MDLVDEDDQLLALLELFQDAFQTLLELATVLRAGDDERQVQGDDPLVGQEDRHPSFHDPLRQPFDDGGLADPRLAEQDGVVLRAAREDLDDAVDLFVPADERVERLLGGEGGQVAAVLGQERQLLLLLRRLALLGDGEDLLAHRIDVETMLGEDAHRSASLDAQQADEQVLGTDRGVQHALGLMRGIGQDLLGLFGEGELGGGGDALDEDALAFDLAADVFGLHLEAPEDLADRLLAFAEYAEQDVLGFDDPAAELAGLVAGEEESTSGFFIVLLKHAIPR